MIISHRGLYALVNLICWGTRVKGSYHRRQDATPPAPPPSPTPTPTFATTWDIISPFPVDKNETVRYTVDQDVDQQGSLPLMLLWTSAAAGTTPETANTFQVFGGIPYRSDSCPIEEGNTSCSWVPQSGGDATFGVSINASSGHNWDTDPGNFFLCFAQRVGKDAPLCRSFSKFFSILRPAISQKKARQQNTLPSLPTTVFQVTATTDFVSPFGVSTVTSPVSRSTLFVVQTPTATVTTTPTPSAADLSSTPSTSTASKAKGSLPLGAIIGIAVGGAMLLIGVLVLLFICYRRKRRVVTPSEQVLLSDNMMHHADSSRALSPNEKVDPSSAGMLGSILETRPSSGPYEHLEASAPYNGPIGPAAHRRRLTPTNLSAVVQPISRNVSDASAHIPVSPHSAIREGHNEHFDEPYHDTPVYGDARHIPQVYAGSLQPLHSSSPTPFLSEPGMTDEELAMLEEEERRIDLAIAEAERRR
ncbi:hypothetical protein B0O99DRAFT_690696 [Bisporella sp. PMI_857]|nr:hypothetical protein B0O99DRAFT_690696 [Bisporella sp. PMI_857]